MEASRLREYLKAKESDANKPWNKPDWPGPKARQDNEQSIRELEEIKKRTALRAYSMGNLTPAQYDEAGAEVSYIKPELPCASKDYHVSGLIAKAQIREYLSGTENSERQRNETQRVHSIDIANTCKNVDASVVMSKMAEGYTSMFDLTIVPAQSNVVLPEVSIIFGFVE
ncbi:unnamed protein product [Toxocara canis]|uniref:Pre-mRNA-splicing factor SLU7 n=1 Tax=Toxocara canis TaxID=6265 RepID=A0A183V893_TOXCA|nr:unnamed protein product [Toxocara canis]